MFAKFKQQGYPASFAPLLMAGLALVLATGLALVPLLLVFQWEWWDFPWKPSGLTRIVLTASHVVSGFLVLALIGAVWTVHARAGWLRQERHISGTGLLMAVGILTVTAPLLLYVSHEESLTWIATAHTAIGGLLPLILLGHALQRRKR